MFQIITLRAAYEAQKHKYDGLKKTYGELLKVSGKKDLQIAAFEQKSQSNYKKKSVGSNIDLSSYEQFFTEAQLNELRKCSQEARSDALFIRKIITFLYGDCDVSQIPTLRRRIKYVNSQEKISDEIINRIESMVSLRLEVASPGPDDYLYHISQSLFKLFTQKNVRHQ